MRIEFDSLWKVHRHIHWIRDGKSGWVQYHWVLSHPHTLVLTPMHSTFNSIVKIYISKCRSFFIVILVIINHSSLYSFSKNYIFLPLHVFTVAPKHLNCFRYKWSTKWHLQINNAGAFQKLHFSEALFNHWTIWSGCGFEWMYDIWCGSSH